MEEERKVTLDQLTVEDIRGAAEEVFIGVEVAGAKLRTELGGEPVLSWVVTLKYGIISYSGLGDIVEFIKKLSGNVHGSIRPLSEDMLQLTIYE